MSGAAVLRFDSDIVGRLTVVFPRPCTSAHASTIGSPRGAKPAKATRAGSAMLPPPIPSPSAPSWKPRDGKMLQLDKCSGHNRCDRRVCYGPAVVSLPMNLCLSS